MNFVRELVGIHKAFAPLWDDRLPEEEIPWPQKQLIARPSIEEQASFLGS